MVSTKKTIKPINDSMDNVARAVVKPKQEQKDTSEKNKETNKYQKRDNLAKKRC
ncbi:MAG: hypothetical protein IJ479_04670 [Alphaproteobacteria bacterium]|nr:hypothetical protein [Alphaproteobacteria bacterium]